MSVSDEPDYNVWPRLAPKGRLQVDPMTGKPALVYADGVLLLNPSGAAILNLCDGHRSLSEIVASLSQQYAVASDHLRGEVTDYLRRLEGMGLVRMAVLPETSGSGTKETEK